MQEENLLRARTAEHTQQCRSELKKVGGSAYVFIWSYKYHTDTLRGGSRVSLKLSYEQGARGGDAEKLQLALTLLNLVAARAGDPSVGGGGQRRTTVLEGSRLAGHSYKQWVLGPYKKMLRLRSQAARGYATMAPGTPPVVARLFGLPGVPDPCFWLVVEYAWLGDWRRP